MTEHDCDHPTNVRGSLKGDLERGYRDKRGRLWVYAPYEGWRINDQSPYLRPATSAPRGWLRRFRAGVWEFFHALDGVQVRWHPFAVRHEPPRWEDR